MKTKTFVNGNIVKLDEEFNKFDAENKIKFAQTSMASSDGIMVHKIVAFYEDK